MTKRGWWNASLLLLLAAIVSVVVTRRPASENGPAEPCFRTRDDALQYAIARILAAEKLDTAGDPYTSTFTRSYTTVGGEKSDFFLVANPDRELDLAQSFALHGFAREALAHYENLNVFYPQSPQAAIARSRVDDLRKKTVLALVPPLSVVIRDAEGRQFAQAAAPLTEPPGLDQIEKPLLEIAVPAGGHVEVVGFVDDAGDIVRWADGAPKKRTPSDDEPAIFFPDAKEEPGRRLEGAVSVARTYVALDGRSIFSSELHARKGQVDRLFEKLGPPGPDTAAEYRRAADALIYLGLRDQALEIREMIGQPVPPSVLETDAERIAGDPTSPLHLDAKWLLKVRNNPRFTLTTKSAVTTGTALPIEVEAAAIDSMTFSFARFEGPLPATEKELKEWLGKAVVKPSHVETLPICPGPTKLQLPVRETGSFRVTAKASGLSCDFIAVRTDLSLEVFALPSGPFITASKGGLTVASAQKPLGTTDDDGFMVPAAPLRGRICAEHRDCCSGCESCDHHHGDNAIASSSQIFVTGRGQFFRASAKLDLSEVAKVQVPSSTPLLFVHTDRPAYKAGDTLKFRGILRVPKSPLLRKDETRLLPAKEREVAVAIKCGDASLFNRTYVTGDQGTFQGEFMLPLSAYRSKYDLTVTYEGAACSQPFDVLDYRKSDFAIVLTQERGGVRIQAGYVWGAPVPASTLKCFVGGRPVESVDGFVSARDGESVEVSLMRGEEELTRKSLAYRAPVEPEAPVATVPAAESSAPKDEPSTIVTTLVDEPKPPPFVVTTDKKLYRRGESIEIALEGPWDGGEAVVVVGDLQLYDLVRVPIRQGRGTARVPVRGIHDPGVTVFAICNGRQAQTDIQVRTNLMTVAIDAPAQGRPGEAVDVTVKGDPGAAFALSAVDEAIYMIREDESPEIYSFFYPSRPAALAHATFGAFEYDGEKHPVEELPSDPAFKPAAELGRRLFRGKGGIYDTIGVGVGGGGGGRYGGRFGGRENLVARGGGTRATESAAISSLKSLCTMQRADGSWAGGLSTQAGTISDVGATGLCVLAFVGAGYTPLSKDQYPDPRNSGQMLKPGEVVKKGLQWLVARQGTEGMVGPAAGDAILNHALAALALSEAYGMTASQPLKDPAQAAMDWLVSRQSANGGWPRAGQGLPGELLTSTFAVMALESAKLSELSYKTSSLSDALSFFTQSTDQNGFRGDVPTRAEVAGQAISRMFIRRVPSDSRVIGAAGWLANRSPDWNQPDFLGWYLTSMALFQTDGPDGPCWKAWHDPVKNVLVVHQARAGTWTVGNESVVHTALGSLILEIYYRYANVFGSAGSQGKNPYHVPLISTPRVRIYFPDTVFWAPEMVTDEKGEAKVSFKLPDQITTTRLTARGITKDGAAGQAVGRIATRQPFFLKILAPEFAVLDDEIDVRVDLYNYTTDALETSVRLEGAPDVRTTTIPTDRPATVSWRVRATDPAGLRIVAHAESGAHRDSMERRIPVHRVGRESFVTTRGKAETGGSFGFDGSKGVQDLVVKIRPQKGNLSHVLDALRYLNQYPYG